MSLVVASLLAAGGLLVGRWIAKATLPKGDGEKDKADGRVGGAGSNVAPPPRDPFEGFPCRVGDVVIRTGGDEAWLAGALVLSEELPVAALFVAPEAGTDRALYVRPRPRPTLVWLEPLAEGALTLPPEPPTALEHQGRAFTRVRRLPVHVTRVGTGAPDVRDPALIAEYAAPTGEQLLVVTAAGTARAWRGAVLEEGTYDVLPGGKTENEEA